ncbi:MAG: hypothetical protein JWN12_241 [Candidatus Saccharibacteria bacterium]|nr:hypothetical protein [Candidatus Saccharibacteria bacterium]
MINLLREKAWEKWDEFWNEANDEFFKVEDIQDYTAEDNDQKSSLHLWLEGNKQASLDMIRSNKNEWAEQTSLKNIRKIRVHIVDEPYTEYLKWEIEHYKIVNIPLGKERTYLVNRKDVPDYDLGDFMMFDGKKVTRSHYSTEGRMESMDIYENESIDRFITAKARLMQYAKEVTV